MQDLTLGVHERAIHLASALSLGGDLGAFVAYDQRLAAAAELAGLNLLASG